ncbi:molybdopterin molybdotransferase MoeA [Sphingomonas crusticola]|uniref:molybdopterin molybdotransferase MoeA n=1 Tax=Sphingomonas crusticola TaxID=1697973 RepID=UPI000E223407|nr:molybdopterin molybdotransferase MoeA [Sphingomonas crusticola]
MNLLPVAEAQARLLALAPPLPIETLALVEAAGRWAAEDVVARRTQPAADLSAMDGYAIRFADLPGPWQMVGESRAGAGSDRAVDVGEAARIFTGAPMPQGADTVLIQEEAVRDADLLQLAGEGPPRQGAHVRCRGSDFFEGAALVSAGERLTAGRIAAAAMGGHGSLAVRRRPRVTLISTGDELVPPGAPAEGVMLPASNGVMLQAMIADVADVIDAGLVPDRLDALVAALTGHEADIIVTIGGASVGDHDLVRPALLEAGAALDFWKIAMRPGKPLFAGRLGGALVLGLPGNPMSAFVTAHLFLLPLLAHLGGARDPIPKTAPVPLDAPLPAVGQRDDYIRAIMVDGRARPLSRQDSGAVAALTLADALIVRPAGAHPAAVDELVDILRVA